MKASRRHPVFMQGAEPISLFCGDESDGETLRACEQINESLYAYEINGTDRCSVAGHRVHAQRRHDDVDVQAP